MLKEQIIQKYVFSHLDLLDNYINNATRYEYARSMGEELLEVRKKS